MTLGPGADGAAASGRPAARWLAAVAVLAVLSHLPALWAELVYDDLQVILRDPNLSSWSALPGVLSTPTVAFTGTASVYRPVSSLSWGLDRLSWAAAGGELRAWPFHATNLLLHAAVVVLLALVLAPWLGPRAALVAAGVFAVHPATVEDVAWVVGRADVVATLFALAALLALRLAAPWRRVAAVTLLSLLAYGAKEIAFLLPGALALAAAAAPKAERRRLLPAVLASAATLLLFFAWHRHLVAGAPSFPLLFTDAGPLDRVHVALSVLAVYARLLLWPHPLTVEYHWPGEVVPPLLWLGGLALVATTLLSVALPRTRRVGVWLLVILAGLAPVVHLIPFFELIAERYLYVPAIGCAALVAMALERLRSWRPLVAGALLTLLLSAGSALSLLQCTVWLSSVRLFEHAVRHAPASVLARTNLATSYVAAGRVDEAAVQWQALLALDPGHRAARFNLARWHHLRGDDTAARAVLGALEPWRDDPSAVALWRQLNPSAAP